MKAIRHGAVIWAVALSLVVSACTAVENPATGQTQYTSLSPEDEKALGAKEHPKVLAEFGGEYEDPELQAYITRIGDKLKNVSELADEDFTFTLIDSPIVNAFALPGGYVYITRGLLALADNEAEVAGVLGHEIGHVTARHTAQRYDRAIQGQIGATIAQIGGAILGAWLGGDAGARLGGQVGGQLGSVGATAYVQGFSREQEFDADQLGVRYLASAGYDPHAMVTFLEALNANTQLEARERGGEGQQTPSWLASHPRTPDRIARAADAAEAREPGPTARLDRDAFLAAIDGMIYGDSPAQGFIRNETFIHPVLGFRFQAPKGFQLQNTSAAVLGQDRSGRGMIFDMGKAQRAEDPATYMQSEWAKQRLDNVQEITVDGRPAAYALARVNYRNRPAVALIGAISGQGTDMYRFLFVSDDMTRSDIDDFAHAFESFRRLRAGDETYRPLRIDIVTVAPGQSAASLAGRMEVDEQPNDTFAVLNDLGAGGRTLQPGDKVKIVVRE